jgi:RNA polymerase sigma-70 factor (ECF subfamily)
VTLAFALPAGGESPWLLVSRDKPEGRPPRSEREAVKAAQSGSQAGIEELFRRHWAPAYRAAYLIVHDAAAAEDIAQEAFLAALRSLDRFDRKRPFGPWIHRIAVNRAIDWSRARALRREVGEPVLAEGGGFDAHGRIDDELMAALAALPPEQRAIVVLRHLLDYKPREIAEVLGLPPGTVGSRLHRALASLAATLGEDA